MEALFLATDNIQKLKSQLLDFDKNKSIKAILFFMADNERISEEILTPILQKTKKPIIGGIFPDLIFNSDKKHTGILLIPLDFELNTQLFNLDDSDNAFLEQLEAKQNDSLDDSSLLYVFTDAFSIHKERFVHSLFNFFGINPSYIGGGAGSLSFKPFPCIINNNGLHINAAVIGWAKKPIALGVAHGWHPISDPIKVTKANDNQLESFNWAPAFETYKKIVEAHSGMTFSSDNFFDIAKSYPLGISKIDCEMVVRDPYMKKDNTLYTVDRIDEGEYVRVMHGNMDSLLEGATRAYQLASNKADKSMDNSSIFCIDCISRVLFMKDDFSKELELIGQKSKVNGILSIGEIANAEGSFLEIYNKTVVVGIW